jgi:hypothetical protein
MFTDPSTKKQYLITKISNTSDKIVKSYFDTFEDPATYLKVTDEVIVGNHN